MHFPATPERAKQKPIVLVIDDEAGSRDTLRVILRPFFTVQTADSARAALEVLHTQPIDLITLDLKLPDRPGLKLLHDLTQHHAGVEVIIITGYGSLQSNLEGLRQGTAGFLLKPFNVIDLLALVHQALAKKQRLDFLRQFSAPLMLILSHPIRRLVCEPLISLNAVREIGRAAYSQTHST